MNHGGWRIGGNRLGRLLTFVGTCLISVVVGYLLPNLFHTADRTASVAAVPIGAATPTARIDSIARRLADLEKERDGVELQFAIEREVGKKAVRDALKLSTESQPDPDERRYLMEVMDRTSKRMEQLASAHKRIDAAIANLKAGRPEDWRPPKTTTPAQDVADPAQPTATGATGVPVKPWRSYGAAK